MRKPPHAAEPFRVREGKYGSDASYGNNGAFHLPATERRPALNVLVGCGCGWEHVSVSRNGPIPICPTWRDMCEVKEMFWGDDEWVVQFHPAEKDYVNCHPFTLHLWKPVGHKLPTPPAWMVGPKG